MAHRRVLLCQAPDTPPGTCPTVASRESIIMCVCVCMYIYIYIEREREIDRGRDKVHRERDL